MVIPYPNIDPVLLHIWGPIAIRWYAISYIAGLLAGWWLILRMLREATLWTNPPFNGKPPATADDVGDLVVWATLGVILGGRLGWVIIYGTILCSASPEHAQWCNGLPMGFLTNPVRIISAWDGGMSFHGGLTGVVVAVWLFCRRRGLSFLTIGDLLCSVAPVGLFFGRIANFVNGELWGRPTDVPWAMVFPHAPDHLPRHPSQLYEAGMEGILLLAILQFGLRRFKWMNRPGLVCAIFFTGYGVFRFIAEWFREPDEKFIGPISMGMALSIPMWLAAALLLHRLSQAKGGMNALTSRIATLIETQGPISIAQFMEIANSAYYARRDPFGVKGDFITAPEVSQMFGELLGLWVVQCWIDQGRPSPSRLVELGPGRGTLMADALRAARSVPAFLTALEVVLIETSATLRDIQRETLSSCGVPVRWHDRFEDTLADRPLFLLANEFFDALPIRQFVKTDRGWNERMVTADQDGALSFALAPVPSTITTLRGAAAPGTILETSPASSAIMGNIAGTIAKNGGAALIVDYGYGSEAGYGETLQAVGTHRYASILDAPGDVDLSAHVDFASLSEAVQATGASAFGPVHQGDFLNRLGISARAEKLSSKNPKEAGAIAAAVDRLTSPAQMGNLFKVMAIVPNRTTKPSGF